MIGLDTSAIIDIFKGKPAIKGLLKNKEHQLCTTRMSCLELMFGIDSQNTKHREEERFYDDFFETLAVFELNADCCKKAAEIFWYLKKSGKTIEEADCVIAAILKVHGVDTIVTANPKHFERIPGLKTLSY